MSRNEKTGVKVARIAAKVMAMKHEFDYARDLDNNIVSRKHKFAMVSQGEWNDVRALAASALVQTADTQVQRALRGELGKRTTTRAVDALIAKLVDAVDCDDPDVQDAIERDNQRMLREAKRKRERHVGDSLRNFTPLSAAPKRKRAAGPARIKSKRPSSWPPSAKPLKRGP